LEERNLTTPTFEFEFHSKIEPLDPTLKAEAESRLRDLTKGHTDIVGASVGIDEVTGSETPHRYEARVVVYMRPDNVVAVEKDATARGALKEALSAVERQVRKLRERLRETWRQP
jgi:ribosome-associated translation inhibitor RaiA